MSEFDLICRIRDLAASQDARVLCGIGDDGAVLSVPPEEVLVMSTDTLVESVHFLPDVDPYTLGWKSLAVSLSDIAAMGAQPRWATLNLTMPQLSSVFCDRFLQGLLDLACCHQVSLVGGDTTHGKVLTSTMTVLGSAPQSHLLYRSGAQEGDDVWVTGSLGGAALGLACQQGNIDLALHDRAHCLSLLHTPNPLCDFGRVIGQYASSAIDLSDGLLADAKHVAEASGVSIQLRYVALPGYSPVGISDAVLRRYVLAGGDDYQLLLTAPSAHARDVLRSASKLGVPIINVGTVVDNCIDDSEVLVLGDNGEDIAGMLYPGYDHFQSGRS